VELEANGAQYRVVIDGIERAATVQYLDDATLLMVIDGQQHRVDLARAGRERFVAVGGETYHVVAESGASTHRMAMVASPEIIAPMPGKVLQVLVHPGDRVSAGDGLLILEAMKMENRLTAEAAGCVSEVRVAAGDMVEGGQVLAVLAYEEAPQ
jgi:biotin carboxyl carrier protein